MNASEIDREHGHAEHPGIHWPADPDGHPPPDGWSWVERCDEGGVYESDEAAARALVVLLGKPETQVGWFDRETLEPVTDLDAPGQSCAIELEAPVQGRS